MGKTLLYGPDAPEDFLTKRNASHLKSLTGGDLLTAELKNSNDDPRIECRFNVVLTSNCRLTIHLEGDSEAWRRRLIIVAYERQKPAQAISDLASRIVAEEGSGVLNFMLEGLAVLRAVGWRLDLTGSQQRRVDDLLLESDSHRVFVEECLIKDSAAAGMTRGEVYVAYVDFCERRGWVALVRNHFTPLVTAAIQRTLGLASRGDVCGADGKQNDGWKHLRLKTPEEVQQ